MKIILRRLSSKKSYVRTKHIPSKRGIQCKRYYYPSIRFNQKPENRENKEEDKKEEDIKKKRRYKKRRKY